VRPPSPDVRPVVETASPATDRSLVTAEERRWLHDKYERLAAEEGSLAANRTSYFAAVGTVLVTGVVVALADLSNNRIALSAVAIFLSLLGILISIIWTVLLHRTNDAQAMYREAAMRLEMLEPPIEGELLAPITLRTQATFPGNLLRPFQLHEKRFSEGIAASWMDRIRPGTMTEILPLTFLVMWSAVLLYVIGWFFFAL
jgi:hypothetical protein